MIEWANRERIDKNITVSYGTVFEPKEGFEDRLLCMKLDHKDGLCSLRIQNKDKKFIRFAYFRWAPDEYPRHAILPADEYSNFLFTEDYKPLCPSQCYYDVECEDVVTDIKYKLILHPDQLLRYRSGTEYFAAESKNLEYNSFFLHPVNDHLVKFKFFNKIDFDY